MTTVIVDYGSGNVRSMWNALQRVDAGEVVVTSDVAVIRRAERLVVPGVGAFAACMRRLDEGGVRAALLEVVARGVPVLGVCVGMQVLADEGHEFEVARGLGLVPGVVSKLDVPAGDRALKLPHVGFAPVTQTAAWPFSDGPPGTFYFVHSYVLRPNDPSAIAATATYGETFAAVVCRDNVLGVQFHPEKSDADGLRFLRSFCSWRP